MTTWFRRKRASPTNDEVGVGHDESEHDDSVNDEEATEEDLQPRDASEMPRESQNPVNPNADTAT